MVDPCGAGRFAEETSTRSGVLLHLVHRIEVLSDAAAVRFQVAAFPTHSRSRVSVETTTTSSNWAARRWDWCWPMFPAKASTPAHQLILNMNDEASCGAVPFVLFADTGKSYDEGLMGGGVLGGDRAVVLRHAVFLMTKVHRHISAELVQQPFDLAAPTTQAHRIQKIVEPGDQLLVLIVQSLDPRRHRRVPCDRRHAHLHIRGHLRASRQAQPLQYGG